MEIALLGGTGDIGEGLALRWARDTDHSVIVGSRDPEKATRRANDYEALLSERGADADVVGVGNAEAAATADVVVESVTPLLINLAMNNDGMHDLGVRFR